MSLPPPPIDPETDCRHYGRAEFPMGIFEGPGFATLSPRAFKAQTRLVHRSWWEVPAGSLPTLDATLSEYAGFGDNVAGWLTIKAECFASGWRMCADARVYFEPMLETVEFAYALRRRKDRASALRMNRRRTKEALVSIGCVADVLTSEILDHAYQTLEGRGCKNMRGAERAHAWRMIASDMQLLPRDQGLTVVDSRLEFARKGPQS